MKLLITCFEPFGKIATNSSYEVVVTIKDSVNNLEITKLLVPVSYEKGFAMVADYLLTNPTDYIILCGQAAGRHQISLEKYAHNLCNSLAPDNDGVIKNHEIIVEGGNTLTSTFNLCEMINYVNENHQYSVISEDAGGFVCNYLYYRILYTFPGIPCVFIHFPLADSQQESQYPSLPLDVMKNELVKIIGFIASIF